MMDFSSEYFQKFDFSPRQINAYANSARHQLKIALSSQVPEVMFEFAYNALIKFGIYLLAEEGYKIRSVAGHHIKILEKMSEILSNEDVLIFGNRMRQERNFNLYEEGRPISHKEAKEFLDFISELIA